jgi:hypothetical protein
MARNRFANAAIAATLVAGLWAHAPGVALAQQAAPPASAPVVSTVTSTPPATTPSALPPRIDSSTAAPPEPGNLVVQAPIADRAATAGTETSTGIAFGQPTSDAESRATPWSKIPPLSPAPRPGWFLLPPSGCGYYTLLDYIKGNAQEKAPPYPYRLVFYDNDFRYLDEVGGKPVDCLDYLKRIHFGDGGCPYDECGRLQGFMFSLGGEERVQVKNEIGGANGRFNGLDDNYQLLRTRVYGDLWYKDWIRVYVEYLDAQSFNQDRPPLATDVGHSQIQNAFVDLKFGSIDDNPIYGRVGRQELLYGSQRLISPLDWANTRRTFDGAKVFYRSEDFDLDGFWVRPVQDFPGRFDSADANKQFAGAWATYRPVKGQAIDAYYLYLDADLPVPFGGTGGRGGYDLNTFGARYVGDKNHVLWDLEGGYQFGDYGARNVNAGFYTVGLGYAFMDLPLQPQFWAYYDYASGSPNKADVNSTFETFNQLFPFGHYYFGYLDEIGRENIHDWNFQATIYPAKWITALAQYHIFRLDQAKDAMYGTPPGYTVVRFDPTGKAGTDVGEELDFTVNFQLDRHNAILVGFSKFFSGDFIRQTGATPAARDANPEFTYFQYQIRW